MRHRPALTLTARICLLIAERERRALTYSDLVQLTGCSRNSLHVTVPTLVQAGHLTRTEQNGVALFSIPPAGGVA